MNDQDEPMPAVSAWIEEEGGRLVQYIAGQRVIDKFEADEAKFYRERRNRQIVAEFTARAVFDFNMQDEEGATRG